jgi:hypothetical protein
MKRKKSLLYYVYCALGEKSGKDNQEADKIALIRLLGFLSILMTNSFIVANTLRHWNDKTTVNVEVLIDESNIPSIIHSTEKERTIQANCRRFPYD